jgi:hypothetical protein
VKDCPGIGAAGQAKASLYLKVGSEFLAALKVKKSTGQ